MNLILYIMWEKTTILHHYYSLEISTALLGKKKKVVKPCIYQLIILSTMMTGTAVICSHREVVQTENIRFLGL